MDLLKKHFDTALESPDGIKKLRELILTLAMQGKLVEQDPTDEPVSLLLSRVKCEIDRLIIKKTHDVSVCKGLNGICIPKTWKWQYLNDLLIFGPTNGYSPNAVKYETPVRSLTLSATTTGRFKAEHTKFVPVEIPHDSHLWLVDGDILVQRGNTLEYVGVPAIYRGASNRFIYPDLMMKLRVSSEIDTSFIHYVMSSEPCRNFLRSHASGTSGTMPKISQATLKSLPIPLPPLAEQKRIVTKIDELMALCDRLEEQRTARDQKRLAVHTAAINRLLEAQDGDQFDTAWQFITKHFDPLYSVKENVAELKKAILTLAMKGKLVKQDPNDQSASELLKEIQAEKVRLVAEGKIKRQKELSPVKVEEAPYDVPEGWLWTRLGNIGLISSSSRVHQRDWKNEGVPFYRAREVVKLSKYGYVENELYISENLYKNLSEKGLLPYTDDILLTGVGTIGIPYVVKPEDRFYFKDASVLIFKNFYRINPLYLFKYFVSPYWIKTIHSTSMGTTVHTLTINRANDTLIPLPPPEEQKRIVAKIDELMSICDNLENRIAQVTEKQTALFNAVLAHI